MRRVTVRGVERHLAEENARMYLDTVLAVVGTHDGMWKVLDGTLLLGSEHSLFSAWARWGLKEPLPDPVFYENDHFTTDLRELTNTGQVINAKVAEQLQPALRLFAALMGSSRSDPEAVVNAFAKR
jgi:hypothetical protein